MNSITRLLTLLKPQLPLMILGSILAVITVIANISLLAISGWFISMMAIAGLAGVTTNYFTPAAIIRFLAIVRTAGRYAERLLTHRATFNALSALRYYFYCRLEPLLPYYKLHLQTADILARLQQDIDQLDNFYLRVLLPTIVAIVTVPLVCWGISFISPTLVTVVGVMLAFVGVLLPWFMLQLSRHTAKQQTQLGSRLKLELIDGMNAMREMLVYQVSDKYQRSLHSISTHYHASELKLHKLTAIMNAVTFLVINLTVFASLYLLIPQVQQSQLEPQFVASAALLILVCFETVMSMPLALQILPQVQASADRLFEIIDKPVPVNEGTETASVGNIEFSNLSFTYPDAKAPALCDINLTIAPSDKVAIIGASGAGKSTLVNLLMGFWPTESNQLTLNNTDINDLTSESLRTHISLMNQQGHLFHATLADNLRLANPNASEAQIMHACDIAGLTPLVEQLELGLNTWLGETGTGLSGGEAQRLQIAQAILRDAHVMILDEPTRGLDRTTESSVIDKLFNHLSESQDDKAMILITHKPLLLSKMDQIIVMDEGRIITQGTHEELLDNNEYYRQLLNYF